MKSKINLLSRNDFSSTTIGKISEWALSAGRWIVIVTELIVIAAFISRFQLDRQISEYTQDIDEKAAIIAAWQQQESEIRATQEKLRVVNQALKRQYDYDQVLSELGRSLPKDVYLTNLKITGTTVSIEANGQTESSMAGMELKLKDSPLFSQVNLTKIDEDIDEGEVSENIKFAINAFIEI